MEGLGIAGVGLFLLIVMLMLLAGGVWIAMTLAIVGWIGMALFTDMQAARWGENLFVAMWGSSASWELAALPLFIWMGEILFRTRALAGPCAGPADAHHHSGVRHLRVGVGLIGCHLRHDCQGGSA